MVYPVSDRRERVTKQTKGSVSAMGDCNHTHHGNNNGGYLWSSATMILVLFILLVIVLRTF